MSVIHPSEIEFIAEDELIKVTPRFREQRLQMITGNFGPFAPGVPLKIPIWMALNLKNRGLVIVHQPKWMTEEKLKEWLESENADNTNAIAPLHYHYREISRMLLQNCRDNMSDITEIEQLVEDIWNVRISKLKMSCKNVMKTRWQMEIPDHGGVFKIDNFTQMEVNFIRGTFLKGLNLSFVMSNKITTIEQKAEQHMLGDTTNSSATVPTGSSAMSQFTQSQNQN
ncbi:unnamed protein product [Oikopleura dioica]|uniref:GINS complex subunit 2 n=1 Tax=Oikopleura dioica TaxID=34765 RepID=E4XVT0_OIKDI|nr:unnamed protein product [Oikopleura dioica]